MDMAPYSPEEKNSIMKCYSFLFPLPFNLYLLLYLILAVIFIGNLLFKTAGFTHYPGSNMVNHATCSPSCDQKIEH